MPATSSTSSRLVRFECALAREEARHVVERRPAVDGDALVPLAAVGLEPGVSAHGCSGEKVRGRASRPRTTYQAGQRGSKLVGIDADIAHAGEERLEGEAPFQAGEGLAGAEVGSVAEGDAVTGVFALRIEDSGVLEALGVTVGGSVDEPDDRPRGNLDTIDDGVALGVAEEALHGRGVAQNLVDEGGNLRRAVRRRRSWRSGCSARSCMAFVSRSVVVPFPAP